MKILRSLEIYLWTFIAATKMRMRGLKPPPRLTAKGPIGIGFNQNGTIIFSTSATFVGSSRFNRAGIDHPPQITCGKNAVLTIGDNFGMSGGAIFCLESIEIGDNVLFGANSKVYDTDFHALSWNERRLNQSPETAPVKIGDDVWLGANVTVLKGTTIGDRSVIATGSVVTRDIPGDCVAAGSPARVVRTLNG